MRVQTIRLSLVYSPPYVFITHGFQRGGPRLGRLDAPRDNHHYGPFTARGARTCENDYHTLTLLSKRDNPHFVKLSYYYNCTTLSPRGAGSPWLTSFSHTTTRALRREAQHIIGGWRMVTCTVKAAFIGQSTPRRRHHLTSLGDLTQTDMITWLEIWRPEVTIKRGGWKGASSS